MLVPLALTKYFHVSRILISKERQKAPLQVCLGGSLGRSLGAPGLQDKQNSEGWRKGKGHSRSTAGTAWSKARTWDLEGKRTSLASQTKLGQRGGEGTWPTPQG